MSVFDNYRSSYNGGGQVPVHDVIDHVLSNASPNPGGAAQGGGVDPEIYLQLARYLGGTKNQTPGRGEFYNLPGGLGEVKVFNRKQPLWDMKDLWDNYNATGDIPEYVQRTINQIKAAGAKGFSKEKMSMLARHWLQGAGITNPTILAAHNARPQALTAWIQQQIGQYL